MTRFLLPLGGFALLAVVLGIGIKHSADLGKIVSPLIGHPAPAFTLPSLTDPSRTVSSREMQGRWYVINVWGTWCAECRAEHQVLLDVQRAGTVPIIGINWMDDDALALEWLAKLGNPYTAVLVDREGRTAINFGVYGAPETFLVDAQGIVVYKHIGALTAQVWKRDFQSRLSVRAAAKS